jgi:hypothetical protein
MEAPSGVLFLYQLLKRIQLIHARVVKALQW